jgi:hypothetical protein
VLREGHSAFRFHGSASASSISHQLLACIPARSCYTQATRPAGFATGSRSAPGFRPTHWRQIEQRDARSLDSRRRRCTLDNRIVDSRSSAHACRLVRSGGSQPTAHRGRLLSRVFGHGPTFCNRQLAPHGRAGRSLDRAFLRHHRCFVALRATSHRVVFFDSLHFLARLGAVSPL